MGQLKIRPCTLKEANDFVVKNHRHHKATAGHKFSVSVVNDSEICGVAICGRPISRYLDNGTTLEVNRLCTNGEKNACSMLYGACARIARDMGYKKIITYILQSEPGTSLKASGWTCEGLAGGKVWTGKRSGRDNGVPRESKKRWSKTFEKDEEEENGNENN